MRPFTHHDACMAMILTEARSLFPVIANRASRRRRLRTLQPVNDNLPYEPWLEWR